MYTIDAGIFIRNLDPYDPDHASCRELLEQLSQRGLPIIVPLLVLIEVAGQISRIRRDPIRARLAVDALRALPHIRFVPLDEALAAEAASVAGDYYLRGADAIYATVARRHHSTLIALDRELRERPAGIITTRTPAEVLAEIQLPPRGATETA